MLPCISFMLAERFDCLRPRYVIRYFAARNRFASEKTPLPSNWKGFFTEKSVISASDYPKHNGAIAGK